MKRRSPAVSQVPDQEAAQRVVPIRLRFFSTPSGNEPVREWLKALSVEERQTIGQDLMRVQYRWPVGMPLVRPMGGGLWEVRTSLSGNRIARVLFCLDAGVLIALHGFIKKTQKTPARELKLAVSRKRATEAGAHEVRTKE